MLEDFSIEEKQRYLCVDSSDPRSIHRVHRWRAHCRKSRTFSIVSYRIGGIFHLEIRWPEWWIDQPGLNTLRSLPSLHRSSGSGHGTQVVLKNQPLSREDGVVRQLAWIMESYECEELREARRAPLAPLPPPPPLTTTLGACFSTTFNFPETGPSAIIRLRLPDIEYDIVHAGLEHFFAALPRPIPLANLTCRPHLTAPGQQSEARFPGLMQRWSTLQGIYPWEERFPPGQIQLTAPEDYCSTAATRPVLDEEQNNAIFWFTGMGVMERFCGFVRLSRQPQGWQVKEISYDDDWEETLLDPPFWHPVNSQVASIDPDWKRVHLEFPQSEAKFFVDEDRQRSDRLYQQLISAEADASLLDLQALPTLHGSTLSLRQLLAIARDREELFWDLNRSPITQALTQMGHPVLAMRDAPASSWKLLAHLQDSFPCNQAGQTWMIPGPIRLEPYQEARVEYLQRILERAGCKGLQVRASDGQHPAFQRKGETLARCRIRDCVFERQGTLWLSALTHGYPVPTCEIMAQICEWGDPEETWLPRLWRAYIIESARLPRDIED